MLTGLMKKYDLVRTIRVGDYKYIRNYQPFNIDALFNFYRYKMLAFQEWSDLFDLGNLNPAQEQFFQDRSSEALYDLKKDPHENNDISSDPTKAKVLIQMRAQLKNQVSGLPDLSFFPEPFFLENGLENPLQFGQTNKNLIAELIDIADLNLLSYDVAKNSIGAALEDANPWKRYWGLIVCSSFGREAEDFFAKARLLVTEDEEKISSNKSCRVPCLGGRKKFLMI